MNCPQCDEKTKTVGGGGFTNLGRSRYYTCDDCGIKFYANGSIVRILSDEPELPFRNGREAVHSLYQAVKDDKSWFGGMTEETEELARVVFRVYLIGRRSRPVV
jgi:hypothetical protein